jgi:hypothetical protein
VARSSRSGKSIERFDIVVAIVDRKAEPYAIPRSRYDRAAQRLAAGTW